LTRRWDNAIVDRADDLRNWAGLFRQFVAKNRKVYAYANNHYAGHGPGTVKLFWDMGEEVHGGSASCLLLSLAAFVLRFTNTRMPIFVLSMCVAEPSFTGRAVHCCRITTRLIIGRHALTQSLQVRAFLFVEFFEHRHTFG
jgi:hypothetical protein